MSGSEEERERTGKEFDVKVETVQQLETRIAIRLDPDDAVSGIYQQILTRLHALRKLVYEAGATMTAEQDADTDGLRSQVIALRTEYLEHARSRVTGRGP